MVRIRPKTITFIKNGKVDSVYTNVKKLDSYVVNLDAAAAGDQKEARREELLRCIIADQKMRAV